MTAEGQLIDAALRAWKFNADRIDAFFQPLSEEQLDQEIAPGRNRLVYLVGHLAAVNDGIFPLLGLGPKRHPELEAAFLATPDRGVAELPSGAALKTSLREINDALWSSFNRWAPAAWLEKHTAVSDEDFLKEPHRNRYSVLLSRNSHMAFHYGQAILAKPRA
jgi:hypothetical protein